jgi:hypothetical protein
MIDIIIINNKNNYTTKFTLVNLQSKNGAVKLYWGCKKCRFRYIVSDESVLSWVKCTGLKRKHPKVNQP